MSGTDVVPHPDRTATAHIPAVAIAAADLPIGCALIYVVALSPSSAMIAACSNAVARSATSARPGASDNPTITWGFIASTMTDPAGVGTDDDVAGQ